MRHPGGKVIAAHVHNPVPRSVAYTQETLFIKRGRLRVDFFDERQKYLESRELAAGDVILLIKGGHGFEVLEGARDDRGQTGALCRRGGQDLFCRKIPAASLP